MDAETLLPPETLENLYQMSHPEVLVKLTRADACSLARMFDAEEISCSFPDDAALRVSAAIANAMVAPRTPDGNRLFAVSVAVHTDLLGNLTAAAIIDAQEVTD